MQRQVAELFHFSPRLTIGRPAMEDAFDPLRWASGHQCDPALIYGISQEYLFVVPRAIEQQQSLDFPSSEYEREVRHGYRF